MSTLADYQYLWDGTDPGWMLVSSDDRDAEASHVIYNKQRKMILMVDDAAASRAIVEQMLAKGVEILSEILKTDFSIDDLTIED